MSNRLENRQPDLHAELKHGRPLSLSEQRLMGGLASAESRILGTAQLGKMRDLAITALRITTLLGAFLLVPMQEDPSEKDDAEPDPVAEPRVIVVPIRERIEPDDAERGAGTTVNLRVETSGRLVEPSAGSQVTVINHQPLTLEAEGQVVLGAGPDEYWYRTELGRGDYFWALPDGDFQFRVAESGSCAGIEGRSCSRLAFEFDTRGGGQQQVAVVPLAARMDTETTIETTAELGAAVCDPVSAAQPILRCTYSQPGRVLQVDVRASTTPAEDPQKTAFEVRWCEGRAACLPDL